MKDMNLTEKMQIPCTPEMKAALAQVGGPRGQSAYVRDAVTAALRRDGYALNGPADAQVVPVVASPEAWRVSFRSSDGTLNTEKFVGTMAQVIAAYDKFVYLENVVKK